jgi:hypothetical protein
MIITSFIASVIFVQAEIQKVNFLGHEIFPSPCGGGGENRFPCMHVYVMNIFMLMSVRHGKVTRVSDVCPPPP